MGEPGPDGLIVSLISYSDYMILLETQKCMEQLRFIFLLHSDCSALQINQF